MNSEKKQSAIFRPADFIISQDFISSRLASGYNHHELFCHLTSTIDFNFRLLVFVSCY